MLLIEWYFTRNIHITNSSSSTVSHIQTQNSNSIWIFSLFQYTHEMRVFVFVCVH